MPYSSGENAIDVIEFVNNNSIKSILEIGAGSGTYSNLLRKSVDRIDGVEIWRPYVERFDLESKYDKLVIEDIRTWWGADFLGYDMVIFGDILEHMSQAESLRCWRMASHAGYGMISTPIVHYPQGAEFGNPYEEHVQVHVRSDDIKKNYGPFVFEKEYEVTGTYIRRF